MSAKSIISSLVNRTAVDDRKARMGLPIGSTAVEFRRAQIVAGVGGGSYSVNELNDYGSIVKNHSCVATFPPGATLAANQFVFLIFKNGQSVPLIDATAGAGGGTSYIVTEISVPFGIVAE